MTGAPALGGRAGHRPAIDGLRALAIAPVVLHHAAPALLPGGFAGVDVFFVISGYLITGIIAGELAEGRFGLWRFWERRVRRIVPALAAMLAVTALAGWAILVPEDFLPFAKALVASALFASNIHFARGTGYFDSGEGAVPLLHTWTLGVEEQFYLVFPLMMLGLWRWRRGALLPAVALVGAASLALALWLAPREPLAAFYLLPTRMWELMLGATAALLPRPARADGRLAAAGVVLILAGLAVIDPETPAPGLAFLLPTFGTALVLRHAGEATWTGRALAAAPLAGLGLISFGLYLWHQPVLALAQYRHFGPLPAGMIVAAVALSVALAALSFVLIEEPVRRRRRLANPALLVAASTAALALPLAAGAAGYARLLLPHAAAEAERRGGLMPEGAAIERAIPPGETLPFVLYGDSHAAQYFAEASARFGPGALLTENGCLSADGIVNYLPDSAKGAICKVMADRLIELLRERRVGTVLWAQRWDRQLYDARSGAALGESGDADGAVLLAGLARTLDRLPAGTRVILLGNAPTAWAAGPLLQKGWLRCRAWRNTACPANYPAALAEGRAVNGLLRGFAARDPRVTYVDAAAPLCPGGRCQVLDRGRLLYWDGSHMTRPAAARVMAQIPPAMLAMPAPLP
jgi:peptidoglycan/LPS O-acetylase OafA/YrhL